jgi:hypothetical protein
MGPSAIERIEAFSALTPVEREMECPSAKFEDEDDTPEELASLESSRMNALGKIPNKQ